DAEGEPHGVERERRDGPTGPTVRWTAEWQHGEWHGDSYLLDPQGRPVSVARFEHGTGLDLWDDEVHPIVDGAQHGAVRWGDPCAPYEEEHYVGGLKHGPHRRWTEKGALEPDFPQFYVEDEPVDRAEYAAACAADPTLPPYKASDDSNRRTIPPALAEARARAAALADTFDLKAYLAAADAAWLALFR
ncbi:MAG: hypothetical protein KC613_06170, partial [Myxococcales bacterium]|nr:hypothetical protein [Myxococcales bacterium]